MSGNNKKNNFVYLTRERLVALEAELRDLKVRGRAEMAQKIAEARGHGDLSENSEYETAKEAQEHLEIRISRLEETLARARIIEGKDLPNDKAYILSTVRVQDQKSKREFTYTLVSPEESNFEENKISVTSPVGSALLGKTKGDVVTITVPAGTLEYKIIDIER
jgi:transcription elongation factor GreA